MSEEHGPWEKYTPPGRGPVQIAEAPGGPWEKYAPQQSGVSSLWEKLKSGGAAVGRYVEGSLQHAGFGQEPDQTGRSLSQRALDPKGMARATNIALSTGPGNIGRATARAAAGLPAPRGDQAMLSARGVPLTPAQMVPGQALGRAARSAEDRAMSMPILGDFISNMRHHNIDGFNRGTINQALEPIGASLPKDVVAGHKAIETMNRAAGQAYEDIFRQMPKVVGDPPLMNATGALELSMSRVPDIKNIVTREWERAFENIPRTGGRMRARGGSLWMPQEATGANTWKAMSYLLSQGQKLVGSERYFEREAGKLLLQARANMFDAIERQYPQFMPDLQKANKTWTMVTRIQRAAQQRREAGGRFTPGDLLQAIRTEDQSLRNRHFGEGDEPLQKWAEAGSRILPSKYPESGTSGRMLANLLTLGLVGGGAELGHPEAAAGTLGLLTGMGAGYRALGSPGARRGMGETGRRGIMSSTTKPRESVIGP